MGLSEWEIRLPVLLLRVFLHVFLRFTGSPKPRACISASSRCAASASQGSSLKHLKKHCMRVGNS